MRERGNNSGDVRVEGNRQDMVVSQRTSGRRMYCEDIREGTLVIGDEMERNAIVKS